MHKCTDKDVSNCFKARIASLEYISDPTRSHSRVFRLLAHSALSYLLDRQGNGSGIHFGHAATAVKASYVRRPDRNTKNATGSAGSIVAARAREG